MSVSAVMIVRNESRNIEACLKEVSFAEDIVVVDSGSTDDTISLAKKFPVRLFEIPFRDFASQKNAAIERAEKDWVFLIDADERLTPELRDEILKITQEGKVPEAVYRIPRLTFFFGRRLRFCDTGGDSPIRLFPKNHARYAQPVHETIETDLPVREIPYPMLHYTTRDRAHYNEKLACYIPLELEVMKQKGVRVTSATKYTAAVLKFLYLYFFRLGILDGWAGLQYSALSSYYVYLKNAKYYEQSESQV